MTFMRSLFTTALVFLGIFLGTLALAQTTETPQEAAASALLEQLAQKTYAILKEPKGSSRSAKLYSLVEGYLDKPTIARTILGREFSRTSEAQQKKLAEDLIRIYAHSYIQKAEGAKGFEHKILRTLTKKDNNLIVVMNIRPKGGDFVEVAARVRDTKGGLKIVDFVVEGISQLSVAQKGFRQELKTSSLEVALEKISAKADSLAFGATKTASREHAPS